MSSGAIAGPGFLLQRGDTATPPNFTTVTEVLDIKGPDIQLDTADVTNQSSPNSYEEVMPTIKRSGEFTFDCNFQPADPTHNQTTGLLAAIEARTLYTWQLIMPNQTVVWTFSGYVTKFSQNSPVVGVMKGSITIKITGKPVLGASLG